MGLFSIFIIIGFFDQQSMLLKNYLLSEAANRNTRSYKKLPAQRHTMYKNVRLTKVSSSMKLRKKSKSIKIEKGPWKQYIEPEQIQMLLKRLEDSPSQLYEAIEKKNIQKQQNIKSDRNRFKFKLLGNQNQQITIFQKNLRKDRSKNIGECECDKQNKLERDLRILNKIKEKKKKYIEQYREILLHRKNINLDSDLPRIKYVKQNEYCKAIDGQYREMMR